MPWQEVEKFECRRCHRELTEGYVLPSAPDRHQPYCPDCGREMAAERRAAKADEPKPVKKELVAALAHEPSKKASPRKTASRKPRASRKA